MPPKRQERHLHSVPAPDTEDPITIHPPWNGYRAVSPLEQPGATINLRSDHTKAEGVGRRILRMVAVFLGRRPTNLNIMPEEVQAKHYKRREEEAERAAPWPNR